jgi:hypothetical protein
MTNFREEFIFYGDEVRIERFPEETRFILANPPMPPLVDFEKAVKWALDQPLKAEPLEKQLKPSSRVKIAFDDLCVPVPLMRNDVRGRVIKVLLKRLYALGIPKENIQLICANGLHRKWTLKELSLVIGKEVIQEMGPERVSCHDGTKEEELIFLGTTDSGYEVEINRAVAESDITIYVNLNYVTMNGGWKSILVGLGSWRSIRHQHTPKQWNLEATLMDPQTSPMHQILKEMGTLVQRKYNIFQIENVVNNAMWPLSFGKILKPINHPERKDSPGIFTRALLSSASLAPGGVKGFIRIALRSNYQPIAVYAGNVETVHQRTLEVLAKQQNVPVAEPVDILILGVPNLSPYSCRSIFNPILLRSLALGYIFGAFRGGPLVKKGGIIVVYNPGLAKFHPRHHPSYIDFWQKHLEEFYDPLECWNGLSESYARNSGYIRKYREDFAYHGTHCLMNWMWSGMNLKHLSEVILACAKEPETAKKIGFTPAKDFTTALSMARERAGKDAAIANMVIPPIFCADIKN